jgi:hypothetical protein
MHDSIPDKMSEPIDDPLWFLRRYGSAQPIGWALRLAVPQRWFRIHSLPDSKRYPETQSDWNTLVARHREVSNALIPPGAACYLLTPWSCAKDACFSGFTLRPALALPEYHRDPDGPPSGGFFVTRFAWDFDSFEPVLRAVATWQTLASVIVEEDLVAYAPYGGGADLFLPDSPTRDAVKRRFAAYLSARSDGL